MSYDKIPGRLIEAKWISNDEHKLLRTQSIVGQSCGKFVVVRSCTSLALLAVAASLLLATQEAVVLIERNLVFWNCTFEFVFEIFVFAITISPDLRQRNSPNRSISSDLHQLLEVFRFRYWYLAWPSPAKPSYQGGFDTQEAVVSTF